MQYGGALPRHLSEHKEMLPQASFQEHKTGVKSKETVTNTDCVTLPAAPLEGSVIAALTVMNQSL